ncbi:MAG: hypothetical protein IT577_13015 [Verrucomicrobiae bacterium]|nr:hypothetical protein [Verrucomicrobiae bacterium]
MLVPALAWGRAAGGAKAGEPPLDTMSSSDGRLAVSTPSSRLSRSLISLLGGLAVSFDDLFPRERAHKGQLRVVVGRGEPGAVIGEYRRDVRLGTKGLSFTLYTAVPPALEPSEFILAMAELMLYDYCTSGIDPEKLRGELPRVPFWIIDGVAQVLTPAEFREDLKGVVYAMRQRGRVPSIDSIQSARGPSESRLERIYQSAFNYWLIQELTRSQEYRKALLSWLGELWCMEEENPVLWADARTVQRWWAETVARSTAVPKEANWNLEESKAILAGALPSELNDPKGKRRRFEFGEVVGAARDALFFLEMRRKEETLMALVQRGDILFRPVSLAYLGAVRALLEKLPDAEFARRAGVAAAERARLEATRNEVGGYLDWFEVARMNVDPQRDFARFFATWRRLERIDVRPDDPVAVPRLKVGDGK